MYLSQIIGLVNNIYLVKTINPVSIRGGLVLLDFPEYKKGKFWTKESRQAKFWRDVSAVQSQLGL